MKVVSLFTGCGGLDLGLHKAGHEIILQCECDPGAQQVLRKAFPGTLLVPDICSLQALPKETELVAAGFPCIDVSRAGLRQGLNGPSTGLVRHVFRLLAQAAQDQRPVPWVLLENVEALIDRCHGGPPLVSWVVTQLEKLGYKSWAHRVICSAGFGVPNRRRRIFILASMHGDARDVMLGQGLHRCMGGCLAAVGGDCWECFDPDDDPTTGNKSEAAMLRCSYALDLGNARSAAGVDVVPTFTTSNARICLLLSNGRYGALRIEDAERLQGLPPGHTQACYPIQSPGLKQHRAGTLRDSESDTRDRARFALLGNAVTVQVAQWLGERLSDPYRYKYLSTDNDMPLHKQFQPSDLKDSVWQALREVRLDQIHRVGGSSGAAKITSRGAADWEQAAAAAVEDNDSSSSDDDANQVAKDPVDAALAAAAKAARAAEAAAAAAGSSDEADDVDSSDSDGEVGPAHTCAKAAAEAAAAVEAAADAVRATGRTTRATVKKVISQRLAPRHLLSSWPKAAWFLQDHGRWGLKEASDTPVKVRFLPLGEFIRKVGPSPPDVALVTYLQRLKEQGWNVDRTERKMIMCGVTTGTDDGLQDMLAGVFHNAETDSAANSIGRLVWARLYNTAARPTAVNTAAGSSAAAAAGSRACTGPATSAAAAGGGGCGGGYGFYWPCEEIDPFKLPRGFKLLPEHRLALSVRERELYLPAANTTPGDRDEANGAATAAAAAAASTAAPATPSSSARPPAPSATPAAAAAGDNPSDAGNTSSPSGSTVAASVSTAAAAAAAATCKGKESAACHVVAEVPDPSRRKVLLIWFHTNQFEWRCQDELLPFEPHKARLKGEASSLMSSNKLARPQEWRRAYREAKHCSTILRRAGKIRARAAMLQGLTGSSAAALAAADLSSSDSGSSSSDEDDADAGEHRAAVAGRAAKQALAVNMRMPRCKVCEACTQSTGSSSRRCLLVRATAAAAAGHAGAQLSVLGEKCVGAEIDVWWPLDAAYYKGLITAYDNLRVRHTVHYEDGDVEIIPLWAPQQRIKLRSQPGQWVARAAQLAAERAQVARDIQAARLRVAGAAGLPEGAHQLTAMEQERADNILRNKEALQRIMTDTLTTPTKTDHKEGAQLTAAPFSPEPAAAAAAAVAEEPTGGSAGCSLSPQTPGSATQPPTAAGKTAAAESKAVNTKARAASASTSGASAVKKPRAKPPKGPTAAAMPGAAASAAAGDTSVGNTDSPQPISGTAAKLEQPAVSRAHAGAGALMTGERQEAPAVPDLADAPSSNRGMKRQAAAAASRKIKGQMHASNWIRGSAVKKRKQTTVETVRVNDVQVMTANGAAASGASPGFQTNNTAAFDHAATAGDHNKPAP